MSYMLQLPLSSPLPAATRSPPYVLFGINDVDHFDELPPKIPLALVLHFAPALRRYILPAAELSKSATYFALRTPFVGINIFEDIDIVGLSWIITCMLQTASIPIGPGAFFTEPSIINSTSIYKAWVVLDLPLAGIQGLQIHLQSKLAGGPPVSAKEIDAIWSVFPSSSPIVLEMGCNFVRSHINFGYAPNEFSSIRHWYLSTRERCNFFRSLEAKFPAFALVQKVVVDTNSERVNTKAETDSLQKKAKTLKNGTKEHKKTEEGITPSERRRSERRKSDSSLSSVDTAVTTIWDPPSSLPTSDTRPTPVSISSLAEMIEHVTIEAAEDKKLTIVKVCEDGGNGEAVQNAGGKGHKHAADVQET